MEEKIKIVFENEKSQTYNWKGYNIEILPYISGGSQSFMLEKLKECYEDRKNSGQDENMVVVGTLADFNYYVLILQTNVDCENIEYEDMVSSGLLSFVSSKIANYEETRACVFNLIEVLKIQDTLPNIGKLIEALDGFDVLKDKKPEDFQRLSRIIRALGDKSDDNVRG